MKKAKIVVLESWPQPDSVAEPAIFANDTSLMLRYVTADEALAIIRFPLAHVVQFGSPNDEALHGHPLYKSGLKFYSVHRVDPSPWIQELERRNSVHPQHDRARFLEDKVHYIFTFQDSTLECVVTEGEHWKAQVQVCTSKEEADRLWREGIGADVIRDRLRPA